MVNLLAGAVVLLTVPVAAVSLAVRFRRARGLERQQLRRLAFAAGLASVGALLVLAGTSLPTNAAPTLALIAWGAGLCLVLLPLAIGAPTPAGDVDYWPLAIATAGRPSR